MATELSENKKNNKRVVVKVVGFMPLQHEISPQLNVQVKLFFSVLDSSMQELEHIKFAKKSRLMI